MSSAANHRARSHQSATIERATFGTIHRKMNIRNSMLSIQKRPRRKFADIVAERVAGK